ncbi:hypothetical protein [Neptunicoccus sediminis]|nr:hypothetical protein [Neptunicoccus sediminis]
MDIFSKIGLTALIATGLLATHVKALPLDATLMAAPAIHAGNSQADITS